MASLKEIKGRINSVKSTQKITAAMKMVASAKLRKAQAQIEHFLPYETLLHNILSSFLSSELDFTSPLAEEREIKSVAIVVLSSNSSLCGAFNSNISKLLKNIIATDYCHLPKENIHIYPIGKKIEEVVSKAGMNKMGSFISLMDKPGFEGAKSLADNLIQDFLNKKIDKIELIYNHFKSSAVQIPTSEVFLPIRLENIHDKNAKLAIDYIVEPDKGSIITSLIPKTLRSKIYAILLDSAAAEHAARTLAMQIATDNAEELLEDLSKQFNKQRQQDITNQLLDIVGGSEALK